MLQTYGKKVAEFPFLLRFIIPCLAEFRNGSCLFIWNWHCLQELTIPNTLIALLNIISQFIIVLLEFFCMTECNYCYRMFVSQLITYNSFLCGFTLSITHFIQGALYAFKPDSVLGICLGLYVLELYQFLKGVSIICINRVW